MEKKTGVGMLSVAKVKSHIDGKQAYCRNTPLWQMMINELADFAADVFTDHFGDAKADKAKLYASQALLRTVCKRVAAIEASLREYATDVTSSRRAKPSASEDAREYVKLLIKE